MDWLLFVLDGTQPVPCDDVVAWSAWMAQADLDVVDTWLGPAIHVSTVFLGLCATNKERPLLLFETLVYWDDGPLDGMTACYATWDDAKQGHAAICARLQRVLARARYAVPAVPPAPSVLPGHLCERCLDAPAVTVQPAPWGGDMGVCADCQARERPQ
jgi:hypothetical protein